MPHPNWRITVVKEFREFVLRGNVVDLAVAVVIGAAFGAVVTSLVENLITPLIAAIFGEPDFSALTFTINESIFGYGAFINALIAFVLVALAVFFVIVKPINSIRARRAALAADEEAPPAPEDIELLREIRDLLERQTS
jgi:large conductance mechanosensitive channel